MGETPRHVRAAIGLATLPCGMAAGYNRTGTGHQLHPGFGVTTAARAKGLANLIQDIDLIPRTLGLFKDCVCLMCYVLYIDTRQANMFSKEILLSLTSLIISVNGLREAWTSLLNHLVSRRLFL